MKAITVKNWKSLLEPENWHPVANMFTLIDDAELNALAENIKMTGLLNPVVLLKGKVLDGRNRLRACQIAGVEPNFVEWDGSGQSPAEWVVAQNAHRRNLTASQKAYASLYLIENLEPTVEQKKQFKKWDKRIWLANMLGIPRHFISDIVQIKKWATLDSTCTQWDTLPTKPQPRCLEDIKTGTHSIVSMCREIEFRVAQLKNPKLTKEENEECPTGQLAYEFFKLIPRHSMRLAYESALAALSSEEQTRLTRYWTRLEKEYSWYEAS
jgi:hypothetical protein